MKPIIMAIVALFLYAFQNVFLEQKLAKFSVFVILSYSYLIMLIISSSAWFLSVSVIDKTKQNLTPVGWEAGAIFFLGVIFFVADSCYIGAYTNGGNVYTVTSIVIMFPIFASLIKLFWVGGLPNRWQVAGYILAVIATLMVIKGDIGSPAPVKSSSSMERI
jgi:drug/metabolite transporter (DMT)-like permease